MSRPFLDAETKALFGLGFIRPIDGIILIAMLVTLGLAVVRQDLSVRCVVIGIFLFLFWLLMLAYRTMYFVLRVTAEIKLMPTAAAKLAVRFATGGGTGA